MKNYLTIGLIHKQLLMFFLEAVKSNGNYSIAVQKDFKGEFVKTYTNISFLNEIKNKDAWKFVNISQINALHINIL